MFLMLTRSQFPLPRCCLLNPWPVMTLLLVPLLLEFLLCATSGRQRNRPAGDPSLTPVARLHRLSAAYGWVADQVLIRRRAPNHNNRRRRGRPRPASQRWAPETSFYPRTKPLRHARLSSPPPNTRTARLVYVYPNYETTGFPSLVVCPTSLTLFLVDFLAQNPQQGSATWKKLTDADRRARLQLALATPVSLDARQREGDACDTLTADYDIEAAEEDGEVAEAGVTYTSCAKHLFHTVMCDEGTKVKNPLSRAHLAVAKLYTPCIWIQSATPALNKPGDFTGYLALWVAGPVCTGTESAGPPQGV